MPDAVERELSRPATPEVVRNWIAAPPPWVSVAQAPSRSVGDAFLGLDEGERGVILLAREIAATLVLMDDRRGAEAARSDGHPVTGTLGILIRAAERGLLDLETAFDALKATSFYCTPRLLNALLARHWDR